MKITVANALLNELGRIGVDTVFGIISIHNIPFYDAIERHGGFRVVSGRHEGAVVHAGLHVPHGAGRGASAEAADRLRMSSGRSLAGKTALVIGGAGGIGAASARLFAEAGARVAVTHRPGKETAVAPLVKALSGEGHLAVPAGGQLRRQL